MPERPVAVVLISGGMDSCVTAAIAARNYEVAALHASYGQRTAQRELKCFNALADHFGVARRLVAQLGYFSEIGGSSLTDLSVDVHDADLTNKTIPNTYVPFRNAHFLAIATMYKEQYRAAGIRMLPVVEKEGKNTAFQIVFFNVVLLPVSIIPYFTGLAGTFYLVGAILLGLWFLFAGIKAARAKTPEASRKLLMVSVMYLPLVFFLMVINSK